MLQVAILFLAAAMFCAIHYIPKRTRTKIRTKNRASLHTNRHLLQASKLLGRARTTKNRTQSQTLAKAALIDAETAIAVSPKDGSARILRAQALVLIGRRSTALRSLDLALSRPIVRSLAERERVEALVLRAELRMEVNMQRRVDSAIEDLEEVVRSSCDGDGSAGAAFCLLGRCYEFKGLKDKAGWAFREALKVDPKNTTAREGLDQIGP